MGGRLSGFLNTDLFLFCSKIQQIWAGPEGQDMDTSSAVIHWFNCFCLSTPGPQFLSVPGGSGPHSIRGTQREVTSGEVCPLHLGSLGHILPHIIRPPLPGSTLCPSRAGYPLFRPKLTTSWHMSSHVWTVRCLSWRARPCLLLSFEGTELCPRPGRTRRSNWASAAYPAGSLTQRVLLCLGNLPLCDARRLQSTCPIGIAVYHQGLFTGGTRTLS